MSGYQTRQIVELERQLQEARDELHRAAALMKQAAPQLERQLQEARDAIESFVAKHHRG